MVSLISEIHDDLEKGALRLMTEYRARLFVDAVRLCKDKVEAEDLVSRTFSKAIFNLDSYKEGDNLYGWMKTIMVNIHRNDLARPVARGTTPVSPDALEMYAGADNSTDEQILRNSDHDALREAINRLDPEYRQMMAMYYYNELSLKEIASFFRTSISSVSRKLEIARKILAAKLGTQLGKKPMALLLAALLGVGTLFGAWVSPLGDWVTEKVFGSAPAAETVQDEEPAPDIDLPSDIEGPDDNELQDNGVEPAGEERVAPTPAPQADTNVISETQKQKGEDNMNISAKIKKTVATAAVAAMGLTAVGETAVYVAENGDDSAAGTFEAPLGTINTALGKSTSVVYVMPGTYSEHDITLDRAVRVVGLGGCRDDVIVDAKEAGRCFSLEHSGAVVSSLTMRNGKGNDGGNLRITGGTVTNCVLSGGISSGNFGGNVYASGGGIVDSVLDGGTTTATYGSGFVLRAEGVNTRVMRCIIRNASSSKSITYGVYMRDRSTIENCLLTGLSCGGTGRVIILDGSTAINCTVVGNTCSHSGIYLFGESARVINCVSIGNGGSSELEIGTGAQWSGFTACASPQTVDGCVTVASVDAARFRDPAGGDYSIEQESPLADRGDLEAYNSLSASNLDLGLRMRPNMRGKVSIGAYEPIADAHQIVARLAGSYSPHDGQPHQCALTVLEPATGWTAKWRDVEDDGEDFSRDETPTYVDVGCYTNVVRISAPDYEDVYLTNTVRIATENVCFVSPSGDDLALGTEADPFRTIARALEFAQSVDSPGRVLLKDGIYRDDRELQLTGPVEVRGLSGDRTKVIVDARGYGRCFYLQNDKAVVSSLTMTNGMIAANGYGWEYRGGNFLLDGGTVTNCVVVDGVSNDGNGCGGNANIRSGRANLVVDCVFEGGSLGPNSSAGGGFSMRAGGANTRVMRCVFRNASCSKSFTYGIYMESGATIENCLLTGFSCGGTGRAIILDGATAVNCTVVGNTCSNSGIYLFGDSARAINCASIGNGGSSELEIGTGAQWSGFTACASPQTVDGCVTVATVNAACFNNPAKGDFTLRGSSPLIGKGSVSGYGDLAVSATDLAGEKRFSGNGKKICIGAYESALRGLAIFFLANAM